jgi:hypothetical protein
MITTEEYINKFRTRKRSFTKAQVLALGLEWPLKKGWKKAMVGLEITEEQQKIFEKGKNRLIRRKKKFVLCYKGDHWSFLWQTLRYAAKEKYGLICMKCGKTEDEAVIHVDHIEPVSLYPEKAYDFSNLQILCAQCNIKKSNKDFTDYRNK